MPATSVPIFSVSVAVAAAMHAGAWGKLAAEVVVDLERGVAEVLGPYAISDHSFADAALVALAPNRKRRWGVQLVSLCDGG